MFYYNIPSYRSLRSTIALMAVNLYIISFAIPSMFYWNIHLYLLALLSILAVILSPQNRLIINLPLGLFIFIFIAVTVVSIFVSDDVIRSARLSVSFIPAILLFILIASFFDGPKDIRLLYFIFSMISLILASMLLYSVWKNYGTGPSDSWVTYIGSPVFLVTNDALFLTLVVPFSLALIFLKPQSLIGVVAALSIFLSLCIVCIFQSRSGILVMVVSLTCFALLIRPKIGLICLLTSLVLILLIDTLQGFSLITKFVRHWDGSGRIPLWLSAWAMFLDAPLLGHGLHTFVLHYGSYLQKIDLPVWMSAETRVVPWAHNLYLEILAEQGIIGLISFILLIACGLSTAWNFQRTAYREVRILSYSAFASLISFSFASAIELTFLRHWVVIILFILLGVIAQLSTFQTNKVRG